MSLISEKLSNGRNELLSLALKKPINKQTTSKYTIKSSTIVIFNQTPEDLFKKYEKKLNESRLLLNNNVIPLRTFKKIDWKWNLEIDETTINNKMDSTPPVLSNDLKSVCFHPHCGGCFETNAIRGNKPLRLNAFTYWEISIQNDIISGTSLMIGIGTKQASLNSIGYINLLGSNDQSYGLTHRGQLVHSNKIINNYCESIDFTNNSQTTIIGCLFNGFNGQLSFYLNGKYLGIAFDKIPLIKSDNSCYSNLYPMVSSTVSKSIFKIEMVAENFPTLRELCKYKIQSDRQSINNQFNNEINQLPKTLIQFLNN